MKILNVTPDQFERALEGKTGELTLDALIERSVMLRMTASGVSVTPESSIKAPTVFAIVNALSRLLASLPFGIVQNVSEGGKKKHDLLPDHDVTKLLNRRPNKWMTRFDYWSLVMMRLLLWGNFYALKNHSRGGRIVSLSPVHPKNVVVSQDKRLRLQFKISDPTTGREQTLGQDRVHFIRAGMSHDGITGISAISQIQESIAMEIAAEKFGGTVFGNGAIPNIILTRKGHFGGDEARSKFAESWDKLFKRRRGTAVLESDEWDVKVVQMSNEDSQFLETRELQRSVIAGAFGVPPHIVGDLKRATFSNISNQTLELLMFTLAPWLENIERATERDMLTEEEQDKGIFSQFDTKRLMRGDPKSMADFISKLRQWGILNANEGRDLLEMDARDDPEGEEFLTPMNFEADDDKEPDEDDEPKKPDLRAVGDE